MPYVRFLNGVSETFPAERCTVIRPSRARLGGGYPPPFCDLTIYVTDENPPRVFVGDGEPYSGVAREADGVEAVALAERFGLAELRRNENRDAARS